MVVYQNLEAAELKTLIAAARSRMAELETTYTREHRTVENVRAAIFILVRDHYKIRDQLKLKVRYRRIYLDTLLRAGEEEAEEVVEEYEKAHADSQEDYENASAAADQSVDLSEEQRAKLNRIFTKLVKLFHPDKHARDPAKSKIFGDLTATINDARDAGNIELFEEIADDPNTFVKKQGWEQLDLKDDDDLASLRSLYGSLQIKIIELIEMITSLRGSSDYELAELSKDNPALLNEIAEEQKAALTAEIEELEKDAAQLQLEIDSLIETDDPKIF